MAVGYNPRAVTDGLVLALDAGNPKNYNVGISTNWVDKVGGNNGTLVGGTYHNDGPFVGAGYVEFDGSGDYLTISDNTDFNFGNGDWTIEGWAYVSSINNYMAFGPTNYSTTFDYIVYDSGSQKISFAWYPYSSSTGFITSASTYPLNSWFHWAVTRSGNTFRIFIDGSLDATGTNSSSLSHAANAVTIGRQTGIPARDFSGYQSNIRVVKGTALYTSNFTPPTKPLTAVTNTVLLTCQGNTIADASSSAHSISVTGNAAANLGSPASAFEFDGTDDYVNAPVTKTASCTFSCWAKSTDVNGRMLFNAGPSGSGPDLFFYDSKISWNTWDGDSNPFASTPASVTDGNWHYYVVVNDASSNAKLYYDGELLGTATYRNASANTNLTIGGNTDTYQWNGSISNFQLHNKVLTASEVTQNYNATKGRYA